MNGVECKTNVALLLSMANYSNGDWVKSFDQTKFNGPWLGLNLLTWERESSTPKYNNGATESSLPLSAQRLLILEIFHMKRWAKAVGLVKKQ